MNEVITLHGGPKHGEKVAVPDKFGHVLVIEALLLSKGVPVRRQGEYTRVTMQGRLTHDFEWSGYTSPAEPLEVLDE